jgi:hypothetical protein
MQALSKYLSVLLSSANKFVPSNLKDIKVLQADARKKPTKNGRRIKCNKEHNLCGVQAHY